MIRKRRLLTRRRAIIGIGAAIAAPAILKPHPVLARYLHGRITAPPPAEASAVGHNTCFFFDDFDNPNTIDVNGTGKPGYLWYPHQAVCGKITAAGDISVSNGVLTMTGSLNEPGSTGYRCRLQTAGFLGPIGVGNYVNSIGYLPKGFTATYRMKMNPADQQNTTTGWPGFWFSSTMGSTYGNVSTYVGTHGELDGLETLPQGAGAVAYAVATHNWQNSGAGWSDTYNTNYDQTANLPGGGSFNWNTFHDFTVRWRTQAQTGGAGTVERLIDGSLISAATVSYSTGGSVSPGTTPASGAGMFTSLEANSMFALMDSGYLWPCQVERFGIWF